MHADVSPTLVEVGPGETCTLSVLITNSTPLIDAYQVALFGLDPAWIAVDQPRLSLFPDEAGSVDVSIRLPATFPAGHRQLSVHVRSENDPANFALTSVGLLALDQHRVSMRVDPVVVTGGSEAGFGLVVTNDGNTTVTAVTSATDPEEKVRITIAPAALVVPPGHQDVVQATVAAKRPWFGQPKVRVITFAVDTNTQNANTQNANTQNANTQNANTQNANTQNDGTRVERVATFIQKPRISRWILSVMGLLAAAAVFATVLSRTFESVVDEAAVDKDLLTEALDKGGEGGQMVPVDPGAITGKVVLFSTGDGVAGVSAELFSADNVKVPVATAATSDDGSFAFGRLDAGTFKIRFSGAGFNDTWYEAGATAADALDVEVELGKSLELNDVQLGGRPGSVAGTVEAADLTGITATLVVPGTVTDDIQAQVLSLDVSADGTFLFEDVPSPATYQLIVAKTGFATETRDVSIGPAQAVDNIEIVLRKGDGTIRGRIAGAAGPLGGVTIEATDGTTKVSTVSLTEGDVGAFALRALATPQIYTLTIARPGYSTETRTVSLATAQDFDVSGIVLERSTGSVGGTVSQVGIGPIGGVTVAISAGDTTITTFTASTGNVGSYLVDKLPIPATYTLTFTKEGLLQQVRVQDLDPAGSADALTVDVALPRNTATVGGIVRGVDNSPVAQATVTLSDGTTNRVLATANDPLGRFSFTAVAPGAYTVTASVAGSSPAIQLVSVIANTDRDLDIRLEAQASVRGQVLVLTRATPATSAPATSAPATTAPAPTTTAGTTTTTSAVTTTAPTTGTTAAAGTGTTGALSRSSANAQPARAESSIRRAASPPGTFEPFVGATVRLFLATDFPGPPSSAVATTTTDLNGMYTFNALEAPQNYVVAVFQTNVSPDPLDSRLIVTQPSAQVTVPTFEIPVLF